jgi:uncharacterized protein YdeI (YjbR/CyaY-like superfamily)
MTEMSMPDELAAALAAEGDDAQQNWVAAPPEIQKIYIDYVSAPRRRRVRQERAAETMLNARRGMLREHVQGGSQTWWNAIAAVWPF